MRAIVFSIDNDYVIPFKVLWSSLVKTNSLPVETPVFILHEDTLSTEAIADLEDYLASSGWRAHFINASGQIPDDLPIKHDDHVSKATFYRLFAASILPENIASVVYMDVDVIVIRSVRALFDLALEAPLAAADHHAPEEPVRLWGDESKKYFQAGVLVIDLDCWRKNGYEQQFRRILANERHRIRWWDQCVLNIAFEDNWQQLSESYNFCIHAAKYLRVSGIKGRFYLKLLPRIKLIHFDGPSKPWRHPYRLGADYWLKEYASVFGKPHPISEKRLSFVRRFRNKYKTILDSFTGGNA